MLLDTDVLVDTIRGHGSALAWLDALPDAPDVSGFAALELVFGCRDATELANCRRFLAQFPVLWPSAAEIAETMTLAGLRLSHGLGLLDALTATLAPAYGKELATFNLKHFSHVPGLTAVAPYER